MITLRLKILPGQLLPLFPNPPTLQMITSNALCNPKTQIKPKALVGSNTAVEII